jgi:hypothetical protein
MSFFDILFGGPNHEGAYKGDLSKMGDPDAGMVDGDALEKARIAAGLEDDMQPTLHAQVRKDLGQLAKGKTLEQLADEANARADAEFNGRPIPVPPPVAAPKNLKQFLDDQAEDAQIVP